MQTTLSQSTTVIISRFVDTSFRWAVWQMGGLWALPLSVGQSRAAKVMGYRKIITYILDTESGTSLRASGWQCAGLAGGREWTGKRRPTEPLYPAQMKYRYEKILSPKGVW